MHSPNLREVTEDSTQFLLTAVGEASANTNGRSESPSSEMISVETEMEQTESEELDMVSELVVEDLGPSGELGRYLRLQREAKKISIVDIAKTTKIPRASLQALEEGRFDDLPGDVFVRGFLRSFARCLKLDGDDVIARYSQCGLCPAPVSSDMADTLLSPGQRSSGQRRSFSTGEPRKAAPGQESGSQTLRTKSYSGGVSNGSAPESPRSNKKSVKEVLKDAFDLRRSTPSDKLGSDTSKPRKAKAEPAIEVVDISDRKSELELVEDKTQDLEKRVRIFVPPALNFGEETASRGPLTLGVIILVIVATLTMSYLLRRPGTSTEGFTQLLENNSDVSDEIIVSPLYRG